MLDEHRIAAFAVLEPLLFSMSSESLLCIQLAELLFAINTTGDELYLSSQSALYQRRSVVIHVLPCFLLFAFSCFMGTLDSRHARVRTPHSRFDTTALEKDNVLGIKSVGFRAVLKVGF